MNGSTGELRASFTKKGKLQKKLEQEYELTTALLEDTEKALKEIV